MNMLLKCPQCGAIMFVEGNNQRYDIVRCHNCAHADYVYALCGVTKRSTINRRQAGLTHDYFAVLDQFIHELPSLIDINQRVIDISYEYSVDPDVILRTVQSLLVETEPPMPYNPCFFCEVKEGDITIDELLKRLPNPEYEKDVKPSQEAEGSTLPLIDERWRQAYEKLKLDYMELVETTEKLRAAYNRMSDELKKFQ